VEGIGPRGETTGGTTPAVPIKPVGVLVVDDQLVFRQAARDVIEAAGEFVLLGEASSGDHAMAAMEELHPDLVLVDVRMRGMDGIATTRRLRESYPDVVVVLVTIEDPLNLPSEVGFCGAADLVRKQDFRPSLLRGLWRAHRPGGR
jgi:DNA-binding NarL/FixJ family response regulator